MIKSIFMKLLIVCIYISYTSGYICNSKTYRQLSIEQSRTSIGPTRIFHSSSRLNAAVVIGIYICVFMYIYYICIFIRIHILICIEKCVFVYRYICICKRIDI
jgi:hypothetical protein